jgi:pimeloyl-ACP methyl ester carboxylesterase
MKISFSHGMESGPWGIKIKRLAKIAASRQFEIESVDYTDTMDPDARVERLRNLLDSETNDCLLVGSSMGGYVSLVASENHLIQGLFLMAPALYIPGYAYQAYSTRSSVVDIVHGWNDDVIPVENSIRFAREPGHSLHLVNGNHALSDVLEDVDRIFSQFLDHVLQDE